MLKDVNVALQKDSQECIENTGSIQGLLHSLHIYLLLRWDVFLTVMSCRSPDLMCCHSRSPYSVSLYDE